MAGSTGKQLNQKINLTVNTVQARQQLQSLYTQLSSITKGTNLSNGLGITNELLEANKAAAQLKMTLAEALNPNTGNLNLTAFSDQLKMQNMSLTKYKQQLSNLGVAGEQAFTSLAKSIITAEAPITRLGKWGQELTTTLGNTVRWQLTSSLLHGVMSTASQAMNYVKNLDNSLNSIRIVTGQSDEQMQRFARTANEAAKALNTTTNAYAQASLIYYQQGLSDKQVQERTAATIKLANVSGQAASKVSDQLTAVWNNFYDGSKSLEYYIDVMTALGASTASSTDEISKGLEKFASIARTTGLSYEYATSALSTVVAATRQSADSVGTSFKTLFSRLQGLSLGETLDDGTTLNKYSKALNTIGVNIKNANGSLKDMDDILDEIGNKWTSLTKAEQVALAQTVGGARNYTGLVSLMDNWDSFQKNLQTAQNAQGTLQKQADIYAESWEAASKHVRAASETIYKNLLDDKFFKGLTNSFGDVLDVIGAATNAMGGFKGVMALAGSFATTKFAPQVSQGFRDIGATIQGITPWGRRSVENLRFQAIQQLIQPTLNNGTTIGNFESLYAQQLAERSTNYLTAVKQGRISAWQQPIYQQMMTQIAAQEDRSLQLQRTLENQKTLNKLSSQREQAAMSQALKAQNGGILPSWFTGASLNNGIRNLGTLELQYEKALQANMGQAYASRIETALAPITLGISGGKSQNISLSNIKDFMSVVQTISNAADQAKMPVSKLIGGTARGQINSAFQALQDLYAANNFKINKSNKDAYVKEITSQFGRINYSTFQVGQSITPMAEEDLRQSYIQAYGDQEGNKRADAILNQIRQQAMLNAEGTFQHENTKKASSWLLRQLSGSQGYMDSASIITTTTSAATTIAYSALQIANASKIFKDDTATATDKMGALVGIGMTIPNTMNAMFGKNGLLQSFKMSTGYGLNAGIVSMLLGGAVAGGFYLNNQYKKIYESQTLGYQAEQAQKQSVTAQQVSASAQEAYDNFIALSNNQLKSQQEIYNNITGSAAQTSAIIKSNQEAMDIIKKYNLSSDQWTIGSLGEIEISSAVRNEVEKQALETSKEASNNELISSLTASLVSSLNQREQMTTKAVGWEPSYALADRGITLPTGVAGQNLSTQDVVNRYFKFVKQNPGAGWAEFKAMEKSIGQVANTAMIPEEELQKQMEGMSFVEGIIPFASLAFGVAKEYTSNLIHHNKVGNEVAKNLGGSPYASDEEMDQLLAQYQNDLENNKLTISNYMQGLISAVQSNNTSYSQELKDLASITLNEQIDIDKSYAIYEEAIKDLKKDNKLTEEQAVYRQLYSPTSLDYLTWDEDTIQGQIIAKRLSISIQDQLNEIYKGIEEEGQVFKGYNLSSRSDLTSALASNATNRYANLIREKQLTADRSLYEALVAQMPINSFSTDLKDFQNWLSEQDMSIQTQQQLESYIIDFGTTFGEETVKWVYDNFTGDEYSKEFRTSFRAALDKTDLTGGAISNLYNIRRTSRGYADTGSDAAIRKNLNTLYEKAINDLGGDAGLLTSLLNSSDFASVLGKLTSSFEITGQLTADQIQAAAAKSEILSQFLDISNVNTGGLATVIRELSSGNLNINQVSTPLLQAFSTAAAPESQRIRGISALTDFDYADSIESAFTQYFKDTKKAISPGWYGGVFYDAPINQFLSQMSTSNQEKYRANVTRMINEGWTTKQFQNQLRSEAPDLYNYIGKITSKKGADEFDMFDMMNSENAFNGPMTYDPATGQLRYNTDYWIQHPEAEAKYVKWFEENGYKDLVSNGELKDLGATQRATQAMMAYQFRQVYSGAEADRKAEYIATYMHDAGNGPMWDQNAAIQGAKDLANSGLVFDDQYRAYFNENAALLGYEPTEEGYQKFVKDYFTIQKAVPASNIPGTNISRGVTTITQATTPINREALKNITNLEDLNNVLAGHMTGILNGGSGLDTLLNLRGAVLDENGTLDYDKTRQILEEELGLNQAQIDQVVKDKIANGSNFSKQIYDTATGTYKTIKTSAFQTAEDTSGLIGFNQAITDAENADQLRYRQEERDWQLQKELAILGDANDEKSLSSRKALFAMLSPKEQEKYIAQYAEAAKWGSTEETTITSSENEEPLKTTAERLEEAKAAAAAMSARYDEAVLNGASTEDLKILQDAKENAEAQTAALEQQLLTKSPAAAAAAAARQQVLDERAAITANMSEEEKQDYYYKLIEQEKSGKGELGPKVASTEEGQYYQEKYEFENMSNADKFAYYQSLLDETNNQIPISRFGQEILDTYQSRFGNIPTSADRPWQDLSQEEKTNLVSALDINKIGEVWNSASDDMKRELYQLMTPEQQSEVQYQYDKKVYEELSPEQQQQMQNAFIQTALNPELNGTISRLGQEWLTSEEGQKAFYEAQQRQFEEQKAAEEQTMLAEQYQKDLNDYNAMSPEQQANVRQMIFEQGNNPILGTTLSQFAQELYTQMASSPVYNMPEQTVENEDTLEKWALDAFNTLDELGFEDLSENFSKINFTGDSTLPSAYEYLQTWLQSQDTETAKALAEQLKIDKLIAENTDITAENTTTLADTQEETEEKETTDKTIGKDTGKKDTDKDKDIFGNEGNTTIINEGGGDSGSGGDEGWWPGKPGGSKNDKVYFGPDRFKIGVDLPGKTGGNGGRGGRSGTVPSPSKGSGGGNSGDNSKIEVKISLASGQNNARLLGYAKGKEGHIAVTGELGPELRVKSDGSMDLLGKTGREYTWVEPTDKIYTANQTASIIGSNNSIPQLDALSKGINNYIPGYAEPQTYVGTPGRPSGSSGGGGGGGGGRSRGGGGEAAETDPRYDPNTLKIRDILERYYTILQKIDDITRAVEKFAKVADRAWGQDRIKAIEKQTALYQQQYDAQKQYVQQINEYMGTDKNALTTMIREFVDSYNEGKEDKDKLTWTGAQFDSNGVLTNYREFVEKLVEQYNANAEANSMSKEAQYKFQEQLKDIQMYTDTLNLWESETDKLQELANQILDSSLKEITYRVEYELELNADQKRLLDFQDSFIKDDIFRVADHIANMNKEIANTADSLEKTRQGLYDYLGTLAGENMRVGETYDDVALGLATRDEKGVVNTKSYEDIDFKEVSNNLDKWLAELREKDAEGAKEVDKILQRNEEGIITNYRDVLNKINALNEQLSHNSINLLLSDAQAFFDQISDLTNNPKWTGLSTEMKDQITNYMDQFIQYIQSMGEEFKEIVESMGDSLKAFGKKIDSEIDEFDYYGDVYKSFGNIIDLTNQHMTDITSDFFKVLNSKALDNNINKIEATRRRYDLFTNTLAQVQQQYNAMVDRMNAAQGAEEKAFYQQRVDELKEQLDIANSQMESAHKDFLQSWEDALSKIQENYKDAVEQASKEFEKGFSPLFNTLALLQAQFDREKALGDLYVDNYQKIHDLNKLDRDITASINDTDNLRGKQRLRDLQEEINQLQEDGTELSEYDLDILDKKYKLELARQALEDAKDAKSMVRLARDNNGNWSYVYTANQDEVDKAEQDYEDAIRDMEQANEDYIKNIQDQILNVQQEAQQAILALQPEDFATYDDYLAAIQNIQNSMYQTLDYLRSQMNNAFGNNTWLENYVPNIIQDHELTDNFDDTTLAGLLVNGDLDQVINNARENFENNLIAPALEAFTKYSEKQQEVYDKAQYNMATIGEEFGTEMDALTQKSEDQVNVVLNLADRIGTEFSSAMDQIVQATNDWLDKIKDVVSEYDILLKQITDLKRIDGEYVEPSKLINGDNAVDTWAEIDRFKNELIDNGITYLITTDPTTGKEKATKYIAGTQVTKDFIREATVTAAKKDIIDVGEDGVDDSENNKVKDYLKAHGIVWIKYKDEELMFNSEEEWIAWYEKHKYVPPADDGGGGSSGGGFDWWHTAEGRLALGGSHTYTNGGRFDTGGYTGRWQSADTGMYTGEWPNGSVRRNGRLAFLHQKELVLNAHDTENFLDAMEIVRQLDNLTNWMANGLGDLAMPRISAEPGELEQNVHIEAEFPNVTDHNEIEQAFNNLVNMASQYANRK